MTICAERQPDRHEFVAAANARVVQDERIVDPGPAADAVHTPGIEPAQTQPVGRRDRVVQDLVEPDDGPRRVGRHDHPGGLVPAALERAPQPDEAAALEQLAVLLVERHLGRDRRALRHRERGRVQLVSEHPEERDRRPRLDRGGPAGLVVRDRGDVGGHRAQGVRHGRPPLDLESLDRVGIVTCPALGRERQEPRIEPTATSGARLEQDLREGRPEPGVQVVDAQDVAVEELALAIGRQRCAERFRDRAVHVPLDVRKRRAPEYLGQHIEQVVDHLRPRHVQDVLLAALRPRPSGDADRPIGVRLEQPTPLADHLRLDPQTEGHPERLDLRAKSVEAAWQLAAVHGPIAERGRVRVALAEPAVVEDEQFDPEVARCGRDLEELRLVEAEIGRLPVIDEDRPRRIAPPSTRQPLAVEPVERVAHRVEARIGVDEDGFGGGERLARLERPGEGVRADADPDSGRVERIDLCLGDEVARIDEAESIGLAFGLGRRGALERDEWVVLVA